MHTAGSFIVCLKSVVLATVFKSLLIPSAITVRTSLWNALRQNYFANRVFESLDAAIAQTELCLTEMAASIIH